MNFGERQQGLVFTRRFVRFKQLFEVCFKNKFLIFFFNPSSAKPQNGQTQVTAWLFCMVGA